MLFFFFYCVKWNSMTISIQYYVYIRILVRTNHIKCFISQEFQSNFNNVWHLIFNNILNI